MVWSICGCHGSDLQVQSCSHREGDALTELEGETLGDLDGEVLGDLQGTAAYRP
jgi:hypothetical protein